MVSGVNTLKVDLVDKMGSDLTVVNAARVSFARKSNWDDEIPFYLLILLPFTTPNLHKSISFHSLLPIDAVRCLLAM